MKNHKGMKAMKVFLFFDSFHNFVVIKILPPLARAFSSCLFRIAMPLFNKKGIFFFEKLPKKM